MKQFKNLDIMGPDEQLVALMEKVSAKSPDGWRRDDPVGNGTDVFSFAHSESNGNPPVRLYLLHESGRLHLSNIVPDYGENGGQLSKRQYNQTLDKFAKMLQGLNDSQLEMDITSDDAAITDQISGEAENLLNSFSNLANQSTGSMHPADFQRWAKFLIRVHKEDASLREDFLSNWLVEELEWPQEWADRLASEYRFARDLLQAYDGTPQ
ncbi:hypothetical protein BV61_02040 [Candidatus Synechococcus spongiarum LMB bulk15M]|uniref:Uncharacterized protein n=1 Tax=Candidatus Synechococcus spongiarum LMB bulk15M TaxID=1943582 RepID=A0A1T1D2H9_9SYNE|nr:hypothetical protein BV61_02040 [Candidatus Synechococcus spongiarum LMB bulk15M]OOV36787.1 hypothetical protein BO98_00300 [Candidatus Synechococcus spongiarum LMB bulk10D]